MDLHSYGSFEVELDDEQQPCVLGRGTFGSTYLARHRFLDTLAALKVINERFAEKPEARKRFLSEARAAAKLDHRHIARVQDFGEAGGLLFYAMEYCSGGSLEERVNRLGATPVEEWLLIARQVAGALVCCHSAGLIHRDLKPSNLMLAQADGPLVVKLIDFGLVHSSRRNSVEESSSGGVWSLLYASPEQLREESLDAKSDLFSLGMSLWHLAVGAPPETGTAELILERRLSPGSYEPRLPRGLPGGLRDILAALLEKDPARRPASAAVLLEMLDSAASALSTAAAPPEGNAQRVSLEHAEAVVRVAGVLNSEFTVIRSEGEQVTGMNYVVESVLEGRMCLIHVLHPELWERADVRAECLVNIAKLKTLQLPDLLRPEALREYTDYTVVVSGAPAGASLLGELKAAGKVKFAEAADLLRRIAVVCDACVEAGVPVPELIPSRIFCGRGDLLKKGRVRLQLVPRLESHEVAVPELLDPKKTASPESLTYSKGGNPTAVFFARLIYRMVAGRGCAEAASSSERAYVYVPELSEAGNQFLAQVIAGKSTPGSFGALLSKLVECEGAVLTAAPLPAEPPPSSLPTFPPAQSLPATPTIGTVSPFPSLRSVSPVPTSSPVVKDATTPKGRSPGAGWKRAVFAVLLFALVAVGGGAWFLHSKGTADLPENSQLEFLGDLPAHAQFKVNGALTVHRREGQGWVLPLGRGKFPVEIDFFAQGYEPVRRRILNLEELKKGALITPSRAKGALILRPNRLSDYDHFSVEMEALLPEDAAAGLRGGERAGDDLREGGETRVSLPTGQYSIMLGGAPSVVSGFAVAQKVVIRAGEEVVFQLPQSSSGVFRTLGASEEARLTLDRDRSGGELVLQSQGSRREGRIRRCKLDNKGILNGEFLDAAGGVPSDFTARLSAGGDGLDFSVVSRGSNVKPQSFHLERTPQTK